MATQTDLEISIYEQAGYADATDTVSEKAKEAFDSLGNLLSEAIAPLRTKLMATVESADEVEIKLDLALMAGCKWVVMSMQGGATVSIKLVWKKRP